MMMEHDDTEKPITKEAKSVKNGNENSLFTDASKQAPQQKAFK
jgi:hypothetical protein